MRLPKTWTRISATKPTARSARYVNLETGVEIEKSKAGWGVYIPGANPRFPSYTFAAPNHGEYKTLADAIEAAEHMVIPQERLAIAKAWVDAHLATVGTPSSWINEAPADPSLVEDRRRAVAAAGIPTGRTAESGQLVVHIETGVPGRFHGTVTYDQPFHGHVGTFAGVTFAGEPPVFDRVALDDVVAITEEWLYCCRVYDSNHAEHGEAVDPECLVEMPDGDLEGPELTEVRPGAYVAADGLSVDKHADGTWWAYGPSLTGIGVDGICSNQNTLGRTYRIINRWRATRNAQNRILAAYVKITSWRSSEVRLAELRAELRDVDADIYDWAVRRIWCEGHGTASSLPGETLTADDLEAAITIEDGDRDRDRHVITIRPSSLQSWARTTGRKPTVDGRDVIWRWHGADDRLHYCDTGRIVDEPMPTHVIIHVITDRAAYAKHLRAEAERENPRFRDDLLQLAAEVTDGTRAARAPYVESFFNLEYAEQYAADLRRYHGYPGKAYEVVPVATTSACRHCHQPALLIDGTWRHNLGRFEIDCNTTLDGAPHTCAPLDGPGPDGQGQDGNPDPDPSPDPATATQPGPDTTGGPGPDAPSQGPVAFGFTIQTRTDGAWSTVRTGYTAPTFRPDPTILTAVAETILGNAGPVLGLGPRDALPTVRVRTWHRPSGLTGSARTQH